MGEVEDRLTGLSPTRRRLVQQLLTARSTSTTDAADRTGPDDAPRAQAREGNDPKRSCRAFFDDINRSLDGTEFGRFSQFLNFGYVPIPGVSAERGVVALPEHVINKGSVRLVLEVIGGCPVDDRRILDIGCGRGGAAAVMEQFFRPRQFVGMDLSERAVTFCRRHHGGRSAFVQGDAEGLPFQTGSMDVVINIESSQSYPNVRSFFREVHRVLGAQGDFLYTDVLPVQRASDWTGLLQAIGFRMEADRDITRNVLLSCDEVARHRLNAYRAADGGAVMHNFLGTPGSHVYEEMKSGRWTYRIMHFRKADS